MDPRALYVHVPSGAWVQLIDSGGGFALARTVREPAVRYVADREERFASVPRDENARVYDHFTEWLLGERVVRMTTGRPLAYTTDQYLVQWEDGGAQTAVVRPHELRLLEEEEEEEEEPPGGGGAIIREGASAYDDLVYALLRAYRGDAGVVLPPFEVRDLELVLARERQKPKFVRFVQRKLWWLLGRSRMMDFAAEATRSGRVATYWREQILVTRQMALAGAKPLMPSDVILHRFLARLRYWFGQGRESPRANVDARLEFASLMAENVHVVKKKMEEDLCTAFWRRFCSVFFGPWESVRMFVPEEDVPAAGEFRLWLRADYSVRAAGERNFMFVSRGSNTGRKWFRDARAFALAEIPPPLDPKASPLVLSRGEWTGAPLFCARFENIELDWAADKEEDEKDEEEGRWVYRRPAEVAPRMFVACAGDAGGVRAIYFYASDESATKRTRVGERLRAKE
jgi:hypothetical protein